MAKTAAQRRAARKRKEHDRARRRFEESPPAARWSRAALVHQLFVSAASWPEDGAASDRAAVELTAVDAGFDTDGGIGHLLTGVVQHLWEEGWQPADVVHVVRRDTTRRVARLAVAAIAEEARASGANERAPQEWVAQLSTLGALDAVRSPVLRSWQQAEALPAAEAWRDTLRLFARLTSLARLQELCPPPSRWGSVRPRPRVRTSGSPADSRVLGRIRGLLAKAESTEFPEEAEALTAKAQELMTRHAVDVAVLDAERHTSVSDQVVGRRVHLDNPYPEAKVQLLDAVGSANGVRVIWHTPYGMATMVGLPVDLDSVELLFTSLLVQATRAVADTGRAGAGRTRSVTFRRSFLTSYAIRIGERLTEARDHVTAEESRSRGTDLVPVMRARDQAVDDAFEALFPEVVQKETRVMDARGWHAGRLAAENADLSSGREQVMP